MFIQILNILYMVLLSTYGNELFPTRRIAGGTATTIDHYPYLVSIQYRFGKHFCGGTILRPMWVLTAAHCAFTKSKNLKKPLKRLKEKHILIWAGSTDCTRGISKDGQLRNAVVFYIHHNFDYIMILHDIGIIQVNEPFVLNGFNVAAVRLPPATIHAEDINNISRMCSTAGWGDTKPTPVKGRKVVWFPQHPNTTLNHVELQQITLSECVERATARVKSYWNICTHSTGKDACKGDSGGPLMCNNIQAGITSWGFECANDDMAGVWTRVDSYLSWIHETLERPIRSTAATSLGDNRTTLVTVLLVSLRWLLY